jgi:hypothetical protein
MLIDLDIDLDEFAKQRAWLEQQNDRADDGWPALGLIHLCDFIADRLMDSRSLTLKLAREWMAASDMGASEYALFQRFGVNRVILKEAGTLAKCERFCEKGDVIVSVPVKASVTAE